MKIRYHTALKGFKPVDMTVISMARGLSAYLCYLYARRSKTIFSEYLLRVPFIEIAQAYQWDFESEFKLYHDPTHPKKGSYKKIDYVIAYNKQVVAIETKFRGDKGDLRVDIKGDFNKLNNIFKEDPRIEPFEKKSAYIFIAASKYIFKSLRLKGIPETNDIDENRLQKEYRRKRNILKPWDSFITSNKIGLKEYCVKAIKVY